MTKRVIAIASAGGHWQQLMDMRAAFAHCDTTYVTTVPGLADHFGASPSSLVSDCSRDHPLGMVRTGWQLLRLMVRLRPDVVITTGALPGVLALAVAKLFRARTIWVDSVANAEEMSMSGRAARRFADLWLSQWEEVAKASGAEYAGSIL